LTRKSGATMKQQRLPKGWTQERIRQVIEHYENQTEDEAVADDEAALKEDNLTMMLVPRELVPEIEALIARRTSA
jgi:hypothetical protein